MLVLGPVAGDRRPLVALGEEPLRPPGQVVRDDRVGRVEDPLGGAVVLLEQDRRGVGEGLLELQDVRMSATAPAVDGLVGVADHAHVAVAAPSRMTSSFWARLVSWYSSTRTWLKRSW